MNIRRPLTARERISLVVFLGGFPAVILGFYVGLAAAVVGFPQELSSIFIRILICALPPTLLAVLAPRDWFIPSLIYGLGFYYGYTALSAIGTGLALVFFAPLAALTGHHPGTLSQPIHSELIWLFIITLWAAAFSSFLRRHYLKPKEA